MDEKGKRRWLRVLGIGLVVCLLIGGGWYLGKQTGGFPERTEGVPQKDGGEGTRIEADGVRFKERPVEIDYSKEPEEILAMYTEEGMNLFKVNFPDTLTMHYALKNIGKEPPEIEGKLMNGEDFALSEKKGQNVILVFSKTTCSICKEMAPTLKEIEENNPDVVFVHIFPVDNKKDIEGFYKGLDMEVPQHVMSLEDNEGLKELAIEQYKIEQVPTFVFVDDAGRISYTYIGSKDKIMFQDMIDTAFGDVRLYDYVRTVTVRVDDEGNEIREEVLIEESLIDEDSVDHNREEERPSQEGEGRE